MDNVISHFFASSCRMLYFPFASVDSVLQNDVMKVAEFPKLVLIHGILLSLLILSELYIYMLDRCEVSVI